MNRPRLTIICMLLASLATLIVAATGCERSSPAEAGEADIAPIAAGQAEAPDPPAADAGPSQDPAVQTPAPAGPARLPVAAPADDPPSTPAPAGDSEPSPGEGEDDLAGPMPPPPATGTPDISFQSTVCEFGSITETRNHAGSYTFTNTGTGTLVIEAIKPTCGCTAVDLTKYEYGPGESGHLRIVFDPTAPGRQRKYIDVLSNDPSHPVVRLTLSADVEAFVVIRPRILDLGVIPYREEYRATVTVTCADPDFTFLNVRTTSDDLTARILPKEETAPRLGPDDAPDARIIEVIVSPDAQWGGLFSWLELTVRGTPPGRIAPTIHTSRIRINGQVFGELQAEPDTFRFGVKPGQAFERRVRLTRRDHEPFNVLEATVTLSHLPGAQVQVVKIEEAVHELILTAPGAEKAGTHCRGAVTVKTDVPGEETVSIAIVGVVRGDP